jgi:biopolymer transport protein ExbD
MDVIFILLIFFMLNSQMDQQQSLSIELPEAEQSQSITTQHIEISLNALDQVSAEGKTLSESELKEFLVSEDRSRPVLLKADQDASYGKALGLFDLLQGMGYEKVSLGTIPPRL